MGSQGYKVAIVGASGAVGRTLCSLLHQRDFPIRDIIALASPRSVGKTLPFGPDTLTLSDLSLFNFQEVDFVFSSPGAKISALYTPQAVEAGAVVIDNTSYFRMRADVPLVVPEVNPAALDSHKGLIANPNCSTIQMVVALSPLHRLATIRRVVVSTYQSVSGAGGQALAELELQTRQIVEGRPPSVEKFLKPIARNVIPQIDVFLEDGQTKEERKMVQETQKILDPEIKVQATCVRVPTQVGHALALAIECRRPITPTQAIQALKQADGIRVYEGEDYPTPYETAGDDWVHVARVRQDPSVENGLALWVVSDNLRKGAALNAVQIAETLVASSSGG